MSGHRQAAVALFGLSEPDRRGILAELPTADQRILRGYLKELASLGFDPAADIAPRAPAAAPQPAPGARQRVHGSSAAAMLAVLGNEPATLVAQLLSLAAWPWAAELIELLPAPRRKLVRDALDGGFAAAPARELFLIDAVASALGAHPVSAPAPAAGIAATLSRWMPWTR